MDEQDIIKDIEILQKQLDAFRNSLIANDNFQKTGSRIVLHTMGILTEEIQKWQESVGIKTR